jgi:hypothetical protein
LLFLVRAADIFAERIVPVFLRPVDRFRIFFRKSSEGSDERQQEQYFRTGANTHF